MNLPPRGVTGNFTVEGWGRGPDNGRMSSMSLEDLARLAGLAPLPAERAVLEARMQAVTEFCAHLPCLEDPDMAGAPEAALEKTSAGDRGPGQGPRPLDRDLALANVPLLDAGLVVAPAPRPDTGTP